MSYFYLPRIYGDINLIKNNVIIQNDNELTTSSLVEYLNKLEKEKIKNKSSLDLFKKKCFPYYFLNSSNNKSNYNPPLNNHKPSHRKFFIYLEILNTIIFLQNILIKNTLVLNIGDYDISIFESYLYAINNLNKVSNFYFFTMNENTKKTNLTPLRGIYNNLLNKKTLTNVFTYYKKYFNIINCDIKLKNYVKYKKTISMSTYIYINVLYSLLMQKQNGFMILKLPNTFDNLYQEILYFISSMYEKVIVIKPQICKNLKPEKYIVCKNLLYNHNPYFLYEIISAYIDKFNENFDLFKIKNILHEKIPLFYINKLNECNAILGQQQLEVLNSILNYCILDKNDNESQRNEKIKIIESKTKERCINWCCQNNFLLD